MRPITNRGGKGPRSNAFFTIQLDHFIFSSKLNSVTVWSLYGLVLKFLSTKSKARYHPWLQTHSKEAIYRAPEIKRTVKISTHNNGGFSIASAGSRSMLASAPPVRIPCKPVMQMLIYSVGVTALPLAYSVAQDGFCAWLFSVAQICIPGSSQSYVICRPKRHLSGLVLTHEKRLKIWAAEVQYKIVTLKVQSIIGLWFIRSMVK